METDHIKPWTVKAIAVEARDLAITAARLEGVSVGIWLERLIRAATAGKPVANLSDLTVPGKPVANLSANAVPLAELLSVAGCGGLRRWVRDGAGQQVAERLGIAKPPSRIKSPNRERRGDESDARLIGQGGIADQSAGRETLERVADRGGEPATRGRSQERQRQADETGGGTQQDDQGAAASQPAVTA